MAQRIKGQEVEVIVVSDGQPVRSLTAVQSFEWTAELEILSEGYLGETTERKDEVYKGISGTLEMHAESGDVFDLERAIIDRARRRTPGLKINIKATLRFPNGDRKRVLFPDVVFASPNTRAGSRTDYVSKRKEFGAADYQVI